VVHTARFSAFRVLALNHVPAGATVTVICRGAGCRFASRSIHVPTTRLVCGRHHRDCKRKAAPAVADVNLEPFFIGSHLAIGDRTTFEVIQPDAIGEEWTLTTRSNQAQAEVGPMCLAPGSHKPGKGC
jgi:hypothetical protein